MPWVRSEVRLREERELVAVSWAIHSVLMCQAEELKCLSANKLLAGCDDCFRDAEQSLRSVRLVRVPKAWITNREAGRSAPPPSCHHIWNYQDLAAHTWADGGSVAISQWSGR